MKAGKKRLAALLLVFSMLLAPVSAAADSDKNSGTVTLSLIDAEGETAYKVPVGETFTFPAAAEAKGYTFRGWQNAWGDWERRESLCPAEDAVYYASYALCIGNSEKHEPYLPTEQDGAFHPEYRMTRREAVQIIYRLLHTRLVGDGTFLDLEKDDPCYAAAATLKTIGVLTGSRMHPDEVITRWELVDMLSAFYPPSSQTPQFDDLDASDPRYPAFAVALEQGWIEEGEANPDGEVTRLVAAHIFNCVDGRLGDRDARREMVGTITDLPRQNPYYWDAAEAAIPHSFALKDGAEVWTSSEALPIHSAGTAFVGVRLHAFDEDGDPVVDDWFNGVYFNADGNASTGNAALDTMLWDIMSQEIDPSYMRQEKMLQDLYFYTRTHFSYSGGSYHDYGETDWEADEAYKMLTRNAGNCYGYAALFCCFAKLLGYNAKAISGTIWGSPGYVGVDADGQPIYEERGPIPHAWVEIEMDGQTYLFDPEMQMANSNSEEYVSFFKQPLSFYNVFGYSKD